METCNFYKFLFFNRTMSPRTPMNTYRMAALTVVTGRKVRYNIGVNKRAEALSGWGLPIQPTEKIFGGNFYANRKNQRSGDGLRC